MRDKVGRVLGDDPYDGEPAPAFPGVYSGTVTRVTAQGLFFTMEEHSPDLEFGPAPWPNAGSTGGTVAGGDNHTHEMTPGNPPKGTQVAVGFSDGDAGQPLVLAIYGWPA